ncbi:hypothetical protein [Nostoc sp.]
MRRRSHGEEAIAMIALHPSGLRGGVVFLRVIWQISYNLMIHQV